MSEAHLDATVRAALDIGRRRADVLAEMGEALDRDGFRPDDRSPRDATS